MADDAHEAGGCATVLDGVAHRFTVQGQRALPGGRTGHFSSAASAGRPSSAMRRSRCIRPGGVDTRAYPRHRSPALGSDGRTPRANPLPVVARTAPACARGGSGGARWAERKTAHCWPAGATARTAADSSAHPNAAPKLLSSATSQHTRASRESSPAPAGSTAPASRLESAAPRYAEPAAPGSLFSTITPLHLERGVTLVWYRGGDVRPGGERPLSARRLAAGPIHSGVSSSASGPAR